MRKNVWINTPISILFSVSQQTFNQNVSSLDLLSTFTFIHFYFKFYQNGPENWVDRSNPEVFFPPQNEACRHFLKSSPSSSVCVCCCLFSPCEALSLSVSFPSRHAVLISLDLAMTANVVDWGKFPCPVLHSWQWPCLVRRVEQAFQHRRSCTIVFPPQANAKRFDCLPYFFPMFSFPLLSGLPNTFSLVGFLTMQLQPLIKIQKQHPASVIYKSSS